jgi:HEPN domain-containing protein
MKNIQLEDLKVAYNKFKMDKYDLFKKGVLYLVQSAKYGIMKNTAYKILSEYFTTDEIKDIVDYAKKEYGMYEVVRNHKEVTHEYYEI